MHCQRPRLLRNWVIRDKMSQRSGESVHQRLYARAGETAGPIKMRPEADLVGLSMMKNARRGAAVLTKLRFKVVFVSTH